jgi:o-succinylbenzoate synthase
MAQIRRLVPFAVPMRVRFRGVEVRSGVLLEGEEGWGEFSPFAEYPSEVTARWLAAAIEAALVPFPEPVRDRVEVNTTVPALDAVTAHRMVAESGCRTAKVKVAEGGQRLADDLERVAAVRDALGPAGRIRVDANGAWDLPTATVAIARLEAAAGGLEYVEQPCRTLEEMRLLRRRITVPLAVDESVRTADDPLRIAGLDAADVLVVKVQPLGGVRRALEVIGASGLVAVVSSALETSVGLAAGVALAAALPELPYACGLGTATLLASDVTSSPLTPVGGAIAVARVVPDESSIRGCRPDDASGATLRTRLDAAHAWLAARGTRVTMPDRW